MVNSLAAIRKNVFEDKKFTMQQLMDAIRTNYEGYEDIRKALLDARKYGNGNDYVDDILTQLYGQWDEA